VYRFNVDTARIAIYDYPICGSFVKLRRREEVFAAQRASLDRRVKRIGN
jgi:hypothetical protein